MSGQKGYTIIEVVLFLAISASLMAIAFRAFSGKQATTEFSQSMQDIQSTIRATLSDTQNGAYPNPSDTTCDLVSGVPSVHAAPGRKLGESQNCIFLGKVLAFGDSGNDTAFQIYTIVGKRGLSTDTTAGANPRVADVLTEVRQTTWGAKVLSRTDPTNPPARHYTNLIGSVNGLVDTRQLPALFTGRSFLRDRASQIAYLNSGANFTVSGQFAIGAVTNFEPVILCFERSDGGQQAQIEVSNNGQGLNVELAFDKCEGV